MRRQSGAAVVEDKWPVERLCGSKAQVILREFCFLHDVEAGQIVDLVEMPEVTAREAISLLDIGSAPRRPYHPRKSILTQER